ncbi:MAG: VOC family protein [Clostridia bacterium]|nr:VOC family protein [Clostridia bacterium]
MEPGILGRQWITQLGLIVRDINATAKKYADFFGMDFPEIITTDAYDKAQTQYNGKPTKARARLAFFRPSGGLEIELIEPDEHPSTWREFLDRNGEGVHHIAFIVKDIKGKVTKLNEIGMPLVQQGEYTGGRYAYVNSIPDLKVMIELLEND